jgi:hypothetical protein
MRRKPGFQLPSIAVVSQIPVGELGMKYGSEETRDVTGDSEARLIKYWTQ